MATKQEIIDGIKAANSEWVSHRAADLLEAFGEPRPKTTEVVPVWDVKTEKEDDEN